MNPKFKERTYRRDKSVPFFGKVVAVEEKVEL